MEQRKRPITYGESLQAKKFAEAQEKYFGDKKEEKVSLQETTLSGVEVKTLPSGGSLYPENSRIYYSPLTFGEMKFLSGSSLGDKESIEFFLNKVQSTFPKEDLTYFDFYYLTILIKMSTFGENDYSIMFECNKCENMNTVTYKQSDLDFDEIHVEMPVSVDVPGKPSASFSPLTIGNYLKMVKRGLENDYDVYMAYCAQGISYQEAFDMIKEDFSGVNVNILETIDASFYHGVKDIHVKCEHTETVGTEEFDEEGEEITREEVCGVMHTIPFFSLPEFSVTSDITKESLRDRIHFGIQNAPESDSSQ